MVGTAGAGVGLAGLRFRRADLESATPAHRPGPMKKDIHPDYRPVVFRDTNSGEEFLTRSTMAVQGDDDLRGRGIPAGEGGHLQHVHPFYTGKMKYVDAAGRVEKFQKKYAKFAKKKPAAEAAE